MDPTNPRSESATDHPPGIPTPFPLYSSNSHNPIRGAILRRGRIAQPSRAAMGRESRPVGIGLIHVRSQSIAQAALGVKGLVLSTGVVSRPTPNDRAAVRPDWVLAPHVLALGHRPIGSSLAVAQGTTR